MSYLRDTCETAAVTGTSTLRRILRLLVTTIGSGARSERVPQAVASMLGLAGPVAIGVLAGQLKAGIAASLGGLALSNVGKGRNLSRPVTRSAVCLGGRNLGHAGWFGRFRSWCNHQLDHGRHRRRGRVFRQHQLFNGSGLNLVLFYLPLSRPISNSERLTRWPLRFCFSWAPHGPPVCL